MYPQKQIIVSIEPCSDGAEKIELRRRRKEFYLRNGYQETGYWMKLAGQTQEILIKNGMFDKRRFLASMALYSCGAAIPKIWRQE